MIKDTITFKGERLIWQNFTIEAKKRKQEIWSILKPFLENYIKVTPQSNTETSESITIPLNDKEFEKKIRKIADEQIMDWSVKNLSSEIEDVLHKLKGR